MVSAQLEIIFTQSRSDKTDFSDNRFRLFDEIGQLALGKGLVKEVNVDDKILKNYVGTYELDSLPIKKPGKDRLFIRLEDGKLYATLSNGTGKNMYLAPQSATVFILPDIKRIHTTIEFILTDGKVTGLYWTQEKKYKCVKVKD